MGVKEKGEVWMCKVCGNEVKVISVGGGILVCCSKPMEMIKEGEPVEEDEELETEDKNEEKNWGDVGDEDENLEEEVKKGFAG
jgi:desulfoferrodoxin-like iron-binding protein